MEAVRGVENCVFQHTPQRKRGINAILADVNDFSDLPKRSAHVAALDSMQKQQPGPAKPRGNPAAGNLQKAANRIQMERKERETPKIKTPDTMSAIIKDDRFPYVSEALSLFLERNFSPDVHKALAIHIFSQAILQHDMGIMEASKLSTSTTGFSDQVIRRWATEYYSTALLFYVDEVDNDLIKDIITSNRGHHPKSLTLMACKEFQKDARQFVHKNACVKGQPNLTSRDFAEWVKANWGHDIADDTARRWLHKLGFNQQRYGKGVYFDGHEREDAVASRERFLDLMTVADQRAYNSSNVLCEGEKPILRVYHDETTFYTNTYQTFYWSDDTNIALRGKSLGQAIMVSDYIDEAGGFLTLDKFEAREYLEHSKEGYFTNKRFVEQALKAVDIFNAKYPGIIGMFIFDNAPSHRKLSEDQLNVKVMNVGPGGKQPKMKNTIWNDSTQTMTLPDGSPKGMRIVLEERGVDTSGWTADRMRQELRTHHDFCNAKTIIEEEIESRGHMCVFLPKFHCELNPIERVWCHAKKHVKAHNNGTVTKNGRD